MSLENIGKYGNIIKGFKGISESEGTKFNILVESITDMKDASELNNIFKAGNVPKDIAKEALTAAGFKDAASTAEAVGDMAEAIGDVADAAGDGTGAVIDMAKATEGLSEGAVVAGASAGKLSNAFTGLAISAKSFVVANAPILAIAATLGIIIGIANNYHKAFDKAVDKTKELTDSYSETKNELDSLNSKLEETQSRIDELQSQDSLTITEENELSKLQLQNAELKTQIKLKEQLKKQQQKEAEKQALDTLSLNRVNDYSNGTEIYDINTGTVKQVYKDTDILTATQNEIDQMKSLKVKRQELIDAFNKKGSKVTESDSEQFKKDLEEIDSQISTLDEGLADHISTLSTLGEALADSEDAATKKEYEKITQLTSMYTNIDLSPLEQQKAALDSFFSASSGKNAIKEKLIETVQAGGDVIKTLQEMGLTLADLGVQGEGSADTFIRYFAELGKTADKAKESIDSVDGSFGGVEKAFESENQGKNWSSMSDYLKQADDLYKKGKIGTDEFQSTVQWILPKKIDTSKYTLDAEAYAAAWEKAYGKVKNWFDSENPVDSMWNFVDSLKAVENETGQSMATVDGDKIKFNFKTTAEAAKELGVSAEVVDTMLHNLEEYGFEFEGITFSGEALNEYETALQGLQDVYDNMDEGSAKDALGETLKGYNEEYGKISEDLTELTQDKIIKIQFDYDIAQIDSEIENLGNYILETGGDVTSYGEYNARKSVRLSKYEKENGVDESNSKGYKEASDSVSALQEKLGATTDESQRQEIQQQISAVYDLQTAFQKAYSKDNSIDWEKFMQSDQCEKVFEDIEKQYGIQKEDIKELIGLSKESGDVQEKTAKQEKNAKEEVNHGGGGGSRPGKHGGGGGYRVDETSYKNMISEIEKWDDNISDDEVLTKTVELVGVDNATPIIELWDAMEADPKFANLDGKDKATYLIGIWNGLTPEQKEALINGKDNATEIIKNVDLLKIKEKEFTIRAIDKATSVISSVKNWLGKVKDKVVNLTVRKNNPTSPTSSNTSKKETEPAEHAKGTLPAHASGTNVSKDGKLLHDETAVINELSSGGGPHKSELVVRDGKVLEFNDGYPTYADLKRGDVVLNHLQAKQLREKGYVRGSHAKIIGGESAFASGSAISNAYVKKTYNGRLPSRDTTSSSSGSSGGKTEQKKTTGNSNNNDKKKKTTSNKWDSFEKWLEKLFDWIEIRLDKLSKITERWTSLAENAVNYSKKEYYYKKAISATSNEIKNNKKAEDKYRSFALQVGTKGAKAAGIDNPKQWAKSMLKNLENGVLLNSKGKVSGSAIKTYGEKKSSILDSMNEWLQKAISSKEKVQELADSYADLYESLENLANNKADEKVDKLSDALSTLETKYDLATSLTQKQSNIASQNKNAKDVLLARQTAKNTTSSSLSSAKSALKKLGFKPDGKTAIDVTAKMKPKQIQAVARYNKALEANQTAIKNLTEAQNEYSKTIYENTHTLFTNIIDDFEYLQSIIEHKANLINKAMELNEAKGYRNSQVYYRQSLNSAQDKQNSLTDEYADAKAQLEKNLKNNPSYKGTDNYKDDLKTLHDLEEQLWDVDIEMAELQQSLNELEWDNFDKLQESISRVSDEAEFLIDELSRKELTDNDIGGLTDEGKATMALYAGNYGTAKEQAKLYADEIQKWKEQLAKDPENQTLIDHIHELEDAQRDYISSVQDTKYAMIDLAKEGFEAQKQFLQDTIDKYKDLMETQEDAYEYQKTLNDMVKEINNVQKQIEVYSGDTSEENRAKLQQLNADLKDKQESLQDTQRQKLTSDINDMFDDLMDNYGDYIDDLASKLDENFDSLINAVNAGLSDTKTTIEEFAKGIGINISDELSKIQSGTDVLQNTKEGITSIVGGQQAIIDSANVNAEKIINAIHQKEEKLDNDLNKAQNTGIKNADTAKAKAAAEKAKASEAAKAKTRAEQEKAEKLKEEQAKKNANDYQKALKFIVEHFYAPKKGTKASDIKNTVKKKIYQLTGNLTVKEADLKTLAKQLGVKESNLYSKLNSLGVFKSIGKNGTVTATAKFAKGTKKVPKDMIGQVGEKGSEIVYRSADGSILTPLGENDMVFTHEMSKNLYELAKQRNIATVPGLEDSGYNKTVNNNNIQGGDVNVYLGGVTITGVQSAEELTSPAFQKQFANALKSTIKKDRNVRGLLMEVTVNEAFDKHHNSLAKNRW